MEAAQKFLSACPVRGTTNQFVGVAGREVISIRVPREGHDCCSHVISSLMRGISIRVPREGHDSVTVTASGPDTAFLSACPVRGTTSWTRR